jgi:hypothetical protein
MKTKISVYKNIHTYHSRFVPEGVTEASQIFLYLAMSNTADVIGGKPIADHSLSQAYTTHALSPKG